MPEVKTVDEVVSTHTNTRGGIAARPVQDESVATSTGVTQIDRSGVEEDSHGGGGRKARALKDSTTKLLEKIEKEEQDARAPAAHEEGDADEDEAPGEDADGAGDTDSDGGDTAELGAGEPGDVDEAGAVGEGGGEETSEGETESKSAEDQAATSTVRLEARNRELLSELETARKTPKVQRSERETALMAAETAYIDEGSVQALRKFLSVIVGAAPDSKEVSAELAGLYTDLTAGELGVALDQNQQAFRDNARTRLLLARDRREQAEAGKKPATDNSAGDVQYGKAAAHVEGLLATKGQSGTSIADEYPMLMDLAEDFDGVKPSEVLARAIRQEIMTGTLDPETSDLDMIRAVAPKIEKYYDGVAARITAARAKKTKKPDTTTPSGTKPKVAVDAGKEQRQSTGARTLTNAAASRAPAKPIPKTTQPKTKTIVEKSRKDFQSDAAWRQHLLDLHFPS